MSLFNFSFLKINRYKNVKSKITKDKSDKNGPVIKSNGRRIINK